MNLDLQLYREIEQGLANLREQLAAELVTGKAQSFDDYRYRVGRLKGLTDALEVAIQAQKSVLGVEGKR